jgi:predicted ATPase/transcriptional regulator with XRE-family HTH domain
MATGKVREPAPFGALLQRYRLAAGLTQEQLAARAGISLDAVAALEQGRRRTPRSSTVGLLADALALANSERAALLSVARTAVTSPEAPPRATDFRDTPFPDPPPAPFVRLPAAQPTPMVDRVTELAIIWQRLTVDGARLLTLVGPAGVGKTRLALAAAAQLTRQCADCFADGVVVVDLTPVRDPEQVLDAIGRAYGFTDTSFLPLRERIAAFLQDRALLLVLDNFEQVLPAAVLLAELLATCPRLALLVTSRVPLQLRWEQTLRIAPLAVPNLAAELPPVEALLAIPSIGLFVGQARARRADFALTAARAPLVAQLVTQLDGLPLALELAAARLDVLSLPTLTRRLGDRLRLLASEAPDRPERQRSLEAAVGWSYDLLSEAERWLFRCLGVFVGGVTLEAIAAVVSVVSGMSAAASDGKGREVWGAERTLQRLLSLAEKSLVLPARLEALGEPPPEQPPHDGELAEEPGEDEDLEPAFAMLETVREYAQEQLAAQGELEAARRAHAHYFLTLAERAKPQLVGRAQRVWFFRLEREHDNLRAALRWLFDQDTPAEREVGLRLAGALAEFWLRRGYNMEGRRWLEEALARVPAEAGADPAVRTRALLEAGPVFALQSEFARAQAVLEEALVLAEQRQDAAAAAEAYTELGLCAVFTGELEEAERRLREAMRRWEALVDNTQRRGGTLFYCGLAADAMADTAAAEAHYTAALRWLEAAGDTQLAGFVHCYLGVTEWKLGDLPGAIEHTCVGLQTSMALRDRYLLSFAAQAAVLVLGERAEPAALARLLGAADAMSQATGATYAWERLPVGANGVGRREHRVPEEWDAAYHEGRSLPFGAVAALALRLLEEVAKTLAS